MKLILKNEILVFTKWFPITLYSKSFCCKSGNSYICLDYYKKQKYSVDFNGNKLSNFHKLYYSINNDYETSLEVLKSKVEYFINNFHKSAPFL